MKNEDNYINKNFIISQADGRIANQKISSLLHTPKFHYMFATLTYPKRAKINAQPHTLVLRFKS